MYGLFFEIPGANLMARSNVEVDVNEDGNFIRDHHPLSNGGRREYLRARSIFVQKLPLQEAMKNNNSASKKSRFIFLPSFFFFKKISFPYF